MATTLMLLFGTQAHAQTGSSGENPNGAANKSTQPDVPGPSCSAPPIPDQFKTTQQQNAFVDKARAFQQCLQDYIAKQQSLSAAHAKAGNEAADTWNAFARAYAGVKPAATAN
jgi:hypothetical protein